MGFIFITRVSPERGRNISKLYYSGMSLYTNIGYKFFCSKKLDYVGT